MVPNNAKFLKPTLLTDVRKSQDLVTDQSSRSFIKRVDQRFKEECTFQPQINTASTVAGTVREMSREERWKKLTEPRRDMIKQRGMQKAQKEIEEIQTMCPFKPNLDKKRSASATRQRQSRDSITGSQS